jgi:outer membrane protein assembly factor BamE
MPSQAEIGYHPTACPEGTDGLRMKKLLIIITCFASINLAACSFSPLHLVYKIDIQQGNVVTQDKVNQLKTGMNRSQIQFIMGTPLVIDTFHQNRWDYVYYFKPGYGKSREQRVTLFFKNDALADVTGTIQPEAGAVATEKSAPVTVVVPPYERVEPGLLNKIWHWITFRKPPES